MDTYYDELGTTLGEALLAPTRIYVKALKAIKDSGVRVKACSHITGGGFYENIPRMLPDGDHAVIEKNSYPIPPIFTLMAEERKYRREDDVQHLQHGTWHDSGSRSCRCGQDHGSNASAAGDTPYVVGKMHSRREGRDLMLKMAVSGIRRRHQSSGDY